MSEHPSRAVSPNKLPPKPEQAVSKFATKHLLFPAGVAAGVVISNWGKDFAKASYAGGKEIVKGITNGVNSFRSTWKNERAIANAPRLLSITSTATNSQPEVNKSNIHQQNRNQKHYVP